MIIPIILSGGGGTRLWPLSRKHAPKQFLSLLDNRSILQTTLLRLNADHVAAPIIICNTEHQFMVAEQLRAINLDPNKIILEPVGRNTAPAIAIAALYAQKTIKDDPILLILPSDHLLENVAEFHRRLNTAVQHATEGKLVTFGIQCHKPETGYGYIKAGSAVCDDHTYHVDKFVEKPDLATAQNYVASGNYYWNSGMFVSRASVFLEELQQYAPDILADCQNTLEQSIEYLEFLRLPQELFSICRSESIDYAVLEHSKRTVVLTLDANWRDIGCFSSLWETKTQDENGNVIHGDVLSHNVNNSYIHADRRMIAAIGIDNTIVVETADAVLVANKNHAQAVKDIVEKLNHSNRKEVHDHPRVSRPWGTYEILAESKNYKVKHIIIRPGASLSLQLHHHRSEHWIIVHGEAEVTLGDSVFLLQHNQSTYIPPKIKHRLINKTDAPLEIIEVQSGEYLGEDDIVRFEDNYGRC